MGRNEILPSVKAIKVNRSIFVPIGDGDKEKMLRGFNLKCWREAKKTGKSFALKYDQRKGIDVIRIKRVA